MKNYLFSKIKAYKNELLAVLLMLAFLIISHFPPPRKSLKLFEIF